jgi:hypothetical protein
MTNRGLTPEQRRAAAMLAAGKTRDDVSAELGVAPKTISRWNGRDDFRSVVRKTREGLLPETPTAEAVLTAALVATRTNGEPDWQARIAAAKALLSTPVATPEGEAAARQAIVERIYVGDGHA